MCQLKVLVDFGKIDKAAMMACFPKPTTPILADFRQKSTREEIKDVE